ncbi:MAG: TetR/AcrR family transcriptional regulator [Spirochaetaceae bacterium]|jgi:AcrR family transcriptional regulator|nr:TetR/AcrR family transcriptional regulator [Spirochaetaceae bacterium]
MTDEEILNTAFQVWSEDFYQKTSLSMVARALGITKPALYRHFRSKAELLSAMRSSYFDRVTLRVKDAYLRALSLESMEESSLCITMEIARYFLENRSDFIFWIVNMHNERHNSQRLMLSELAKRGIDFQKLLIGGGGCSSSRL